MDYPARRRRQLVRQLKHEGVEAFLIGYPPNVTYLTGFTGDSSYLLLQRARSLVVNDPRYAVQLEEECPGLETHIRPPSQLVLDAVAEVVRTLGLRTIGFERSHISVADWEKLRELVPATDWKGVAGKVEALRMVKDSS